MTRRAQTLARWKRLSLRQRVMVGSIALLSLGAVIAAAVYVGDQDGIAIVDGANPTRSYVTVFALVALDAVIPIFPGETTLNAASTAAAQGTLDLVPIMAMGALGAIVGDSALFWITRRSSARIEPQLEKALKSKVVRQAMGTIKSSAPALIVGGRYIPGMRFVVTATMGLSDMRYRDFVWWSVLGGTLWSVYTCALAYTVATTLSGFPLASVVISGLVTTTILAVIFFVVRARRREHLTAPTEEARDVV